MSVGLYVYRIWSHKSEVKARAIAWAKVQAKPQANAEACAKTPVGVDTTSNMGGACFVAIVTVWVKCPGAM